MRYTVTTFKVRLEVAESGTQMRNSETAEIVARGIFNRLDADKEHFVVMGTNNKNQINGYKEVSTGTSTSSLVSPGEVFLAALRLRAAAIICVHNHPSGVMHSSGLCGVPAAVPCPGRVSDLLDFA